MQGLVGVGLGGGRRDCWRAAMFTFYLLVVEHARAHRSEPERQLGLQLPGVAGKPHFDEHGRLPTCVESQN